MRGKKLQKKPNKQNWDDNDITIRKAAFEYNNNKQNVDMRTRRVRLPMETDIAPRIRLENNTCIKEI